MFDPNASKVDGDTDRGIVRNPPVVDPHMPEIHDIDTNPGQGRWL